MTRYYEIATVCNEPGCDAEINMGLAYRCIDCDGCFCYEHLYASPVDDRGWRCSECFEIQHLEVIRMLQRAATEGHLDRLRAQLWLVYEALPWYVRWALQARSAIGRLRARVASRRPTLKGDQ